MLIWDPPSPPSLVAAPPSHQHGTYARRPFETAPAHQVHTVWRFVLGSTRLDKQYNAGTAPAQQSIHALCCKQARCKTGVTRTGASQVQHRTGATRDGCNKGVTRTGASQAQARTGATRDRCNTGVTRTGASQAQHGTGATQDGCTKARALLSLEARA
eukprot:1159321-Pelagomonas_calceolata.AAC.2